MKTLEERFWEKVDKNGPVPPHRPELGPCWIWTACVNKDSGYGAISVANQSTQAHRVSWILNVGPIPEGMCVLHACDHPPCVNPSHLFLGTLAENNADMDLKGRARRIGKPGTTGTYSVGSNNPAAKITEDDVIDIRTVRAMGAAVRDLASAYGISVKQVWNICSNISWTHV